jgi:predicted nuclease of predicted toxin-antitoxin system
VRLLLDAHVSGPRVGKRLEARGHDVRALDQEPALEGLDDEEVLATAASEQRILVTHNIRDFPSILREWAAVQRSHAGVILVYGIDHREFDVIVRGIERCLELYPDPASWENLALVADRESAGA